MDDNRKFDHTDYDNILISVVMPLFNPDEYFRLSALSILKQTHANLELILVDDSLDAGWGNSFPEIFEDERVVYIHNEERAGIAESLNIGIRNAKGKYIARMDADDISHVKRLEIQLEYMEQHPEVDVSGTSYFRIDENGNVDDASYAVCDSTILLLQSLFDSPMAHPTVIGRREFFLENIYAKEAIVSEDFELWTRVIHKNTIGNIKSHLLKYRFLSSSLSRVHNSEAKDKEKYLRKRKYQKICYDHVLAAMNIYIDKLPLSYVDVLYTRNLNEISYTEREECLLAIRDALIKTNLFLVKEIDKRIAWLWLKNFTTKLYKSKNKKMMMYAFSAGVFAFLRRIKCKVRGVLYLNSHSYDWKYD